MEAEKAEQRQYCSKRVADRTDQPSVGGGDGRVDRLKTSLREQSQDLVTPVGSREREELMVTARPLSWLTWGHRDQKQ